MCPALLIYLTYLQSDRRDVAKKQQRGLSTTQLHRGGGIEQKDRIISIYENIDSLPHSPCYVDAEWCRIHRTSYAVGCP